MTELAYNLFSAQRQLTFAKRHLDEAIARGNGDVPRRDLCPGRLIFMPNKTNREYFQAEVDQCQVRVEEMALKLRRDKVLTRWAWRQIGRRERTNTIPVTSPIWFNAMSPDETIIDWKITNWG